MKYESQNIGPDEAPPAPIPEMNGTRLSRVLTPYEAAAIGVGLGAGFLIGQPLNEHVQLSLNKPLVNEYNREIADAQQCEQYVRTHPPHIQVDYAARPTDVPCNLNADTYHSFLDGKVIRADIKLPTHESISTTIIKLQRARNYAALPHGDRPATAVLTLLGGLLVLNGVLVKRARTY